MADNVDIRANTIITMASLTLTAFTAFAPTVLDLKQSTPDDAETRDHLTVAEIMAGTFIVGTAGMAAYVSGDWSTLIVGMVAVALFYVGYNYVFVRMT